MVFLWNEHSISFRKRFTLSPLLRMRSLQVSNISWDLLSLWPRTINQHGCFIFHILAILGSGFFVSFPCVPHCLLEGWGAFSFMYPLGQLCEVVTLAVPIVSHCLTVSEDQIIHIRSYHVMLAVSYQLVYGSVALVCLHTNISLMELCLDIYPHTR